MLVQLGPRPWGTAFVTAGRTLLLAVALLVGLASGRPVRTAGPPADVSAKPPGAGWYCHKVKAGSVGIYPCYRERDRCENNRSASQPGDGIRVYPCERKDTATCLTWMENGALGHYCMGNLETCEEFKKDFATGRPGTSQASSCDEWR